MSIFSPEVALLIIDMINDFVSEDGVMHVSGTGDIIPSIRQMSEDARDSESPVIYICDSHSSSDIEFETWPRHAENGTPGADVVPQLSPTPGDFVIRKRRYSSFFGTDLDLLLRELGVTKLVLTGTAVDICIYFTAVDAYMRGYQIVVPRGCVVALSEDEKEATLDRMQRLFHAELI